MTPAPSDREVQISQQNPLFLFETQMASLHIAVPGKYFELVIAVS
jgi:hypothetical protein